MRVLLGGGRGMATLAGLGAIALWASETALITFTGDLPPLQIVALAFAIAALPSPLVWRAAGVAPSAIVRQPLGAWLLTVPSLLGYHACLYYAVQKAPAAPAALLQGCTPLLIVIGSALLPGERLRWWHLAGTAAGLVGVMALIAGEGAGAASTPDAGFHLALIGTAAALWGVYSLLTRTFLDVPTAAMGVFYAATAVVAGLAHLLFEDWVAPSATEWAVIAALGLLPMGLALYLWDHGVKRGDLQALGASSYAEPFLGALLIVLLGQGELGWPLLWAGVLIVGGAALAARGVWGEETPADGKMAARAGMRVAHGLTAAWSIRRCWARMLARQQAGELGSAFAVGPAGAAPAAFMNALLHDGFDPSTGHQGRGPPEETRECGFPLSGSGFGRAADDLAATYRELRERLDMLRADAERLDAVCAGLATQLDHACGRNDHEGRDARQGRKANVTAVAVRVRAVADRSARLARVSAEESARMQTGADRLARLAGEVAASLRETEAALGMADLAGRPDSRG